METATETNAIATLETITNCDLEDTFNTISLESSRPLYLHPSDHPSQVLVYCIEW